jgi:hypothetical protein
MEARALISNSTGELIALVTFPVGTSEDVWNYVLLSFPDALWGINFLSF